MKKGRINIARWSSNVEPYHGFRIEVIDESSRVHFLQVDMTPEEFALAISGCGARPCTFELRSAGTVGKKRENKEEVIAFPSEVLSSRDEARAAKFLEPYEVDGWKAYTSDIFNRNRITKYDVTTNENHMRVTFTRYV